MASGSQLRLDFSSINANSTKLKGYKDQFDQLYKDMTSTVNSLPQCWEGKTAEKYVQQFADLKPSFTAIAKLMNDISIELDKISSAFSDTDTTISSQVKVV